MWGKKSLPWDMSLQDVLLRQRSGHNSQSLQEVLDYIAMCCCNKSISFSKTRTTGKNIWMDILVCINLLLKVVWTTLNIHVFLQILSSFLVISCAASAHVLLITLVPRPNHKCCAFIRVKTIIFASGSPARFSCLFKN